jgi:hypothetical protein
MIRVSDDLFVDVTERGLWSDVVHHWNNVFPHNLAVASDLEDVSVSVCLT